MQRDQLTAEAVAPAEAPTLRQLLNVVLAAVVVGALYLGRDFLIPLTLAILLAFVLAPLVRAFRRARLPRVPAVFLAITISLGTIVGVGALIGSQVGSLVQELPQYQGTISAKVAQVTGLTTGKLADLTGRLGIRAAQAGRQAAKAAGLTRKGPARQAPVAAPVEIVQAPPTPLQMARQLLAPALAPLGTAGLVLVVTIFILLQQGDLRDRLIRLIGSSDLYRTTTAMDDAATRLSRYFLAQVGVNAGFGAAVGGGLYLIGVPHAVLWGALSALLRFIPYLGALSSLGLAAAMAAAVDPGWTMLAWTVALFLVVEAATGQLVEPLIYGHSTGLSPVSVVVAAIFWTWLWGPVGLIMSTPLSLCLLVLGRHVPQLEFIEVLLGDKPPLTAVESFYQRVLAGDADDVLQQAELALREAPLCRYYDQVAIKGLLLASADARRRILRRDQLPLIRGAVESLIADLRDHPDPAANPAEHADVGAQAASGKGSARPSRGASAEPTGAILCVCGPGVLDDLAAAILAQLLARQGVKARVASYRDAARETIDQLDLSEITAVCVVHLGLSGRPTRLNYLLSRLDQRVDGIPIILAMLVAEDFEGSNAELPAERTCATSLQDAVDKCQAAVSIRAA